MIDDILDSLDDVLYELKKSEEALKTAKDRVLFDFAEKIEDAEKMKKYFVLKNKK